MTNPSGLTWSIGIVLRLHREIDLSTILHTYIDVSYHFDTRLHLRNELLNF
jgi:hypothetical protein